MLHRAQTLKPGDVSLGHAHELVLALGKAGATRELLQQVVEDSAQADRCVQSLRLGTYQPTQNELIARALMGPRYFGVEECVRHLNSDLLSGGKRRLPKFRWGWEVLTEPCSFNPGKRVHETHCAFLGLSMMIEDWQQILYYASKGKGKPSIYFTDLHCITWEGEKFYLARCEFDWYLMPIDVGQRFTNKTLAEQLTALPEAYEVAPAVVEVSRIAVCYLATGKLPDLDSPRRCQETNNLYSPGSRIAIGLEPGFVDKTYNVLTPMFPKDKEGKESISLAVMRR